MTADELPVPEATSLAVAGGAAPDRTDLLVRLLQTLWEAYAAWQEGGDGGRHAAGRRRTPPACATIGRDVRVDAAVGARR